MPASTERRELIEVDDRTRSFTLVGRPDPPGRALVIVLHGSKQTGAVHREFTGRALDRLADEGRAVVAYLDGYRGNWNDARRESSFPARTEDVDDVAFVRAVVERLATSHGIDIERVLVVGYSNGGQMAYRLLHEAPELAAGAVVAAATMPDAAGFTAGFSPTAGRPAPIAIVAGTSDRIVPYDGGRMAWWARKLFAVDGTALSAVESAEYFAARNGIRTAPALSGIPSADGRTSRVAMERADYGQPGAPTVTLVTVRGGGHTVPAEKAAPAVLGRTGRDLTIDRLTEEVLDRLPPTA
ncbi:alpha/beta hydrolase family esterase [Homoserinibacter sp. YIM 151385]|uniref:alpha/beta hydrolase family esterase n=1 Tax=Homoserinibacter sp. YIM 151385 TaxID=2985506 RepID=UPI0022EFE0D8|nr:PHB depolymerase family esterase [Homoserinibacter sp. YIM 151385]WBU37294.1 dienelactone hydrolase family protein [Homoserinibacter sp. YIM 151385]